MTDVPPTIINLDKVMEPYLNGDKLLTYTSRYLTKPGDNYGGVLLDINAIIRTSMGDFRELSLVAKLPPINNELMWKMFQPEKTCLSENAIYTYLSPAIRKLQSEAGVEDSMLFQIFSEYYGSRLSLDENATVADKNAVLLQENLQTSGFKAGNRHKMFDLNHSRLIMQQIAQFHAMPIAMRLKNPEEFARNIKPYFHRLDTNSGMTEATRIKYEQELFDDVAIVFDNDEKVLTRVKELVEEYNQTMTLPEAQDDLYTTIVHFDMWINNLMIKYDENDVPVQVKLVDFQMAQYESLVNDIIFLLFSSVEISVLEHHFDELLLVYYQSFIKSLKSVGINTDEYSFVSFIKEIYRCATVAICLCLFMIRIILADDSIMPESFQDMDLDVLSNDVDNHAVLKRLGDVIRLAQKYKFFYKD